MQAHGPLSGRQGCEVVSPLCVCVCVSPFRESRMSDIIVGFSQTLRRQQIASGSCFCVNYIRVVGHLSTYVASFVTSSL